MTDDEDESELGWIRIAKIFDPTAPAGVRIKYTASDRLPVLDALGMLRIAEFQAWEDIDDEDGDE